MGVAERNRWRRARKGPGGVVHYGDVEVEGSEAAESVEFQQNLTI